MGVVMLSRKHLFSATLAGAVATAAVLAGAAVASAPLPHPGKFYDNSGQKSKSAVFLYISATNPKQIVKGPDFFHGGSPGSSVDPNCPAGQAQGGFNGAKLKLSGKHYTFTDAWTSHAKILEEKTGGGEKLVPVTLKITLTGTVENAKTISGTLKWKGCTGSKTGRASYRASYDPKFTQ
jgi:hypothetical protein